MFDNHKVGKQLPPRNQIAGFAFNTFENCLLHFLCLLCQFLQLDSKRPWGQHWFYFFLTLVTINWSTLHSAGNLLETPKNMHVISQQMCVLELQVLKHLLLLHVDSSSKRTLFMFYKAWTLFHVKGKKARRCICHGLSQLTLQKRRNIILNWNASSHNTLLENRQMATGEKARRCIRCSCIASHCRKTEK